MTAPRFLLAVAMIAGAAPAAFPQDAPERSQGGSVTKLSDPYMPAYSTRYQYRSRTSPHQPMNQNPDGEYGYRNPGGLGRMQEFYPPGNTFESRGADPVRVAKFDNGNDATSRSMQLQSQMVGNARTQTLNQQIDALARPLGSGYGFGFGGFGGYPY